MDQPNFKEGIVVMLDALGVRSMSKGDSIAFLGKREKFITAIYEIIDDMAKQPFFRDSKVPKPNIITFGDTFIFHWPFEEQTDQKLIAVGEFLKQVMRAGFENEILLRGAIGAGEYTYTKENDLILGPAVTDVANWYEQGNWIGIIATPHLGIRLSLIGERLLKGPKFPIYIWFDQYDVPLLSGESQKLWVICWPSNYYLSRKTPSKVITTARQDFLSALKQFAIPMNASNKFSNTIAFFDWCGKNAKESGIALESYLNG